MPVKPNKRHFVIAETGFAQDRVYTAGLTLLETSLKAVIDNVQHFNLFYRETNVCNVNETMMHNVHWTYINVVTYTTTD